MERLSTKKKLAVVRLYLSGLSYDEIAAKGGVSKGTVANVVMELKTGRIPEAADTAEHIEQLRELSSDLRRLKLTPMQCTAGLLLLTRANECGLDPAEMDRWPMILKAAGSEDEAQEFVRLIYSIQDVQKRTGLSFDALNKKVHELEAKAADLKPVSVKVEECKKQLTELTRRRGELANEVATLGEKLKVLSPQVRELETREKDLSLRIKEMEPKARKAQTTISTLDAEMKRLQDIGLPFEQLAEFTGRITDVAKRHAITPSEVGNRLFSELESLNKGLRLEALVRASRQELNKAKRDIAAAKKETETTSVVIDSLKHEKTKLEVSIKETRDIVSKEIAKMIPVARVAVNTLIEDLKAGRVEALAEVRCLRDEAIEAGKSIGESKGLLEGNQWIMGLLYLVRGEESVEGKQVRSLVSMVVRGMMTWLQRHSGDSRAPASLVSAAKSLSREVEQWKI